MANFQLFSFLTSLLHQPNQLLSMLRLTHYFQATHKTLQKVARITNNSYFDFDSDLETTIVETA